MYSKVNLLYIYIYPLFFRFFSCVGHYSVMSREFLVLYSRSLFVIYCVYSSVYMSVRILQFIPPPLYPLVTVSFFYICVTLFLFCT